MKHYLILVVLLICSAFTGKAQELTDKQICNLMKADSLIWDNQYGQEARVKITKTGKWGLFEINKFVDLSPGSLEEFEYKEIVPAKFDSLGSFNDYGMYTVVKNNNKYGILLNPGEVGLKLAMKEVNCIYDDLKIISASKYGENFEYILVNKKGKWGIIEEQTGTYIIAPLFENRNDVPLAHLNSYDLEDLKFVKKKLKADVVVFHSNGDKLLKARIKKTGKWGLYFLSGSDKIETRIPANFDDINLEAETPFIDVYTKGKVGIYVLEYNFSGQSEQTVLCDFDDFKVIEKTYKSTKLPYLALKRDGKWAWVNWLTGTYGTEFAYDSPENLPNPTFEQKFILEN